MTSKQIEYYVSDMIKHFMITMILYLFITLTMSAIISTVLHNPIITIIPFGIYLCFLCRCTHEFFIWYDCQEIRYKRALRKEGDTNAYSKERR